MRLLGEQFGSLLGHSRAVPKPGQLAFRRLPRFRFGSVLTLNQQKLCTLDFAVLASTSANR